MCGAPRLGKGFGVWVLNESCIFIAAPLSCPLGPSPFANFREERTRGNTVKGTVALSVLRTAQGCVKRNPPGQEEPWPESREGCSSREAGWARGYVGALPCALPL